MTAEVVSTGTTKMINLQIITKDNLSPIMKLKVKDDQQDQVASNAVSIAQAHYSDKAWFRGIYFDDTPVGFVMLSIDKEKKEYWVWRYMIDKNHQGKGYGKAALLQVIDFMKTLPDIEEILLSYVPKENGANAFYTKVGFIDTGKKIEDEVIMKYTLSE